MSLKTKWARREVGAIALVRRQMADPLARNGYALVGSNFASAGLGLVFWFAAARRYSSANVGIDTALISAMGLLGNVAMLNLTNAFNRFVPTAGTRTRRLVGIGYLVTGTLAATAAVVFVVGVQNAWWAPELQVVVGHGTQAAWFVVATVIWTIFTLQDAVLTGLGEAPWVLAENFIYGLLKLIVLVAVASALPKNGVFVAWTAPLIVFVTVINVLIFGRFIPKRRAPPAERIDARVIGRFISADYPASLMIAAVVGLMPLIAITVTGEASSSAYVYLAWTIAYTLHLVSTNVGMSMITEASQSPERLVEYARKTILNALRIVIPLALLLVISAPLLLRVFLGADYADNATGLLQLFALAAIPTVFVSTYLNIMRVQRRMATVLRVTAIEAVLVLGPSIVLLHLWGIVGIGAAWLGAQTLLAIVLLGGEMRTLWLPYVPMKPLRAIVDAAPFSQHRGQSRAARQLALRTLDSSGLAASGWNPGEFVRHSHDIATLGVSLPSTQRRGLLKVATSELGLEALHRELSALRTVRDASAPEIDDMLPTVVEVERSNDPAFDPTWLLETVCEGADARAALGSTDTLRLLLEEITEHMRSLFYVRGARLEVDADIFARLVDIPLATTDYVRTSHMGAIGDARNLMRVRDELYAELAGRELLMSLIHGDLWLGNVLWDPSTVAVRGIVDWHCATVAFPSVDITHLICTTRAIAEQRELGSVVREILAEGRLRPEEAALLESVPGAGEISLRASVLLAWLRHVFDGASPSKRRLIRDLWLTHNVYAVLENLSTTYDPAVGAAK